MAEKCKSAERSKSGGAQPSDVTASGCTKESKGSVDSDPFSSLRHTEDRKQLEMQARAAVAALLVERGEWYVQSILQAEIQRVKKKESEIASVKKKISTVSQRTGELNGDIRREVEAKAEEEHLCKVLEAELKRRSTIAEGAVKQMAERRFSLKKEVEASVSSVRDKYDARKQQTMEVVEENKRLNEEVAQMKKEFDEAREAYSETCKEREVYVESLIRSYREVSREVETLEAKIALVRSERQASEQRKISLRKQLEAYATEFGSLSEGQSMADAEKMVKEQREEAEMRIAELENEKREANETRLKLDKETANCRAAQASHKRELPRLEKAKLAAEKRCRQAQEKAKQRRKSEAVPAEKGEVDSP